MKMSVSPLFRLSSDSDSDSDSDSYSDSDSDSYSSSSLSQAVSRKVLGTYDYAPYQSNSLRRTILPRVVRSSGDRLSGSYNSNTFPIGHS